MFLPNHPKAKVTTKAFAEVGGSLKPGMILIKGYIIFSQQSTLLATTSS